MTEANSFGRGAGMGFIRGLMMDRMDVKPSNPMWYLFVGVEFSTFNADQPYDPSLYYKVENPFGTFNVSVPQNSLNNRGAIIGGGARSYYWVRGFTELFDTRLADTYLNIPRLGGNQISMPPAARFNHYAFADLTGLWDNPYVINRVSTPTTGTQPNGVYYVDRFLDFYTAIDPQANFTEFLDAFPRRLTSNDGLGSFRAALRKSGGVDMSQIFVTPSLIAGVPTTRQQKMNVSHIATIPSSDSSPPRITENTIPKLATFS